MAAAAIASGVRLQTRLLHNAGFEHAQRAARSQQHALPARPVRLGFGVKARRSQVVCMAGHGDGHEEKPKEPEFKPSGWYEKDIPEYRPNYTTAGEGEPFEFGIEDGHHTWHEGDDGEFLDEVKKAIDESGAPTGIPAFLALTFLPGLFTMIFLGIDDMYWLIFTGVWSVVYAGFQMAKPATELNFEPARYDRVYDPPESKPEPWSDERLERV